MISRATIEEVKRRMDIVEVVSDFVQLKRNGSSYKAKSPFTDEKTPSFYVVPSKDIFKCFSSGKGGDAITFMMEIDGLSYTEAIRYLAKKYQVEIVEENRTEEAEVAQSKRESLFIILNFACERYEKLLHEHDEGRSLGLSYFKERGFTDETIKKFKLGYSLDQWDYLLKEATAAGYSEDLLEEAGLIIRQDGKTYDRFRGRVMFPITNTTGKVIGFGARMLGNDKKQPKYINSPESELYKKSQVLFGMAQARQAIRKAENCYLVEGYTDVISMHQAGIENVVASSGTALTTDQVKLMHRFAPQVTVLFDGDAAGIRASLRGIDMLLEDGLDVKAVPLPEGEDPDSYSKQLNPTAFTHYLSSQATDFIRFKANLLKEGVANDPVKKSGVIREILESISVIGDTIRRSLYVKECSTLLDIDEKVLVLELNKILITKRKEKPDVAEMLKKEATEQITISAPPEVIDPQQTIFYQEKESIRLLLNYANLPLENEDMGQVPLFDYFMQEILDEITFTHPLYARMFTLIAERYAQGKPIDMAYFMSLEDKEILNEVINISTTRTELSPGWYERIQMKPPDLDFNIFQVANTNILRLKQRVIQRLIDQDMEKLKSAKDEEIDQVLEDIKDKKAIEVEIAKMLGNVTSK